MKSLLFVMFLILITGCPNLQTQFPPQPPQPVVDTEFCPAAEANIKLLCQKDSTANKYCCDTVAPTRKGKTFTQVCQEVQNNGGIFLNPRCLSTITSCDQIDVCTHTK